MSIQLESISWVTELNFPPWGPKSCNPFGRQRHTQGVQWLLVSLDYLLECKCTDTEMDDSLRAVSKHKTAIFP